MNFSIRQLHAFLALAETRNFTRAAAKVHLSQPALSAAIRSLEDSVGARLFHRDTRHVDLTAEGQAFEGAARRIVREVDTGLDGVRDVLERRRGKVAVALLPSLAAGWLPPILALFCERYPDIGKPAVYLCTDTACSSPITDPATLPGRAEEFLAESLPPR